MQSGGPSYNKVGKVGWTRNNYKNKNNNNNKNNMYNNMYNNT